VSGADLDAPHAARSDSFSDALTVSFGDLDAGVCGTVRLGLSGGASASGLVVLFDRAEVGAVAAESAVSVDETGSWDAIAAAGIDIETLEPLRAWRLSFAGESGSLDLELHATSAPCRLEDGDPVAKLGGMSGFDQPLRVEGTAQLGDRRARIAGLGQRGRSWGEPDWTRIARTRAVSAWTPDVTLSVVGIAPAGERGHDAEALSAVVFDGVEPGWSRVADPRLSTTFDDDGCQRSATLELWMTDDGPVRRAAGDVICGTTLDLGRLRLDTAFLRWHFEGQIGVGRYDLLRHAG
jgi:hypothetical protein